MAQPTVLDVIALARHLGRINPHWRKGQAASNALSQLDPECAASVMHKLVDPFYDDGRLDAFWTHVTNWQGEEEPVRDLEILSAEQVEAAYVMLNASPSRASNDAVMDAISRRRLDAAIAERLLADEREVARLRRRLAALEAKP